MKTHLLLEADLTALLDDLVINQIATSKVETGIQQKSNLYSFIAFYRIL